MTAQQNAFVMEYIIDFNSTRAAIDVGYSPKSAMSIGSQLIKNPKVQKAICEALEDFSRTQEILKQRVLSQLVNLAFSDIRDYLSFGPGGVCLKDSEQLSTAQAAAIVEVREKSNQLGTTVSFKLANKEKSLELIGRHLAMFKDSQCVQLEPTAAQGIPGVISFSEFCLNAGYPQPFPKQIEMKEFGINSEGARMILGSRGYGKTDYVVILGVAYQIYVNPMATRVLIITKSRERNSAILAEIAAACEKASVKFEVNNSNSLRVEGLIGKDNSVSAVTIKSVSLRGRHPDLVIMDDPVTPEDTSEATRNHVQKVYNEINKLTPNILIIGQPVHKYDLYQNLRPKLRKMEVPHGSIPELDHDLEAQRLAGVDEASIQASYFLNVLSEGAVPFENIRYITKFPEGEAAVAFIDPSFEGGDYTAISIFKAHMEGVAVVGFVYKKAWNHCLDDIAEKLVRFNVKKLCFETNSLGDQPLDVLRTAFKGGIGVVGRKSNTNKHSRILAAGSYAHMIHLSKESHAEYIKQVVEYEYKSKHDDAPDSLASGLTWIGLIRGKT